MGATFCLLGSLLLLWMKLRLASIHGSWGEMLSLTLLLIVPCGAVFGAYTALGAYTAHCLAGLARAEQAQWWLDLAFFAALFGGGKYLGHRLWPQSEHEKGVWPRMGRELAPVALPYIYVLTLRLFVGW